MDKEVFILHVKFKTDLFHVLIVYVATQKW